KLINAALADLKDHERTLRDSQVRGEDYQQRRQARDASRDEAAELSRRRTELLARIGEKEALLRALPRRDELRGALAERRSLRPPPLAPTAGAEFAELLAERGRLAERTRELDGKLARAEREAELTVVDESLLAAAARIRALGEQLGRHAEETRQAE